MGLIPYLTVGFVVFCNAIAFVVRATFSTLLFLCRTINYDVRLVFCFLLKKYFSMADMIGMPLNMTSCFFSYLAMRRVNFVWKCVIFFCSDDDSFIEDGIFFADVANHQT